MINPILNALQTRLNEDLKDTEEIYKILEDDSISYKKRLQTTALMFQFHGKIDRLRYAISLIQEMLEQEKLFHQVLTKQCNCQKETEHDCNCEQVEKAKPIHTPEENKEFETIKELFEQLKPYLKEEIQITIDNWNNWYINQGQTLSLQEYKKCMQVVLSVTIHSKYEKKNETWPLLEKLANLARVY